MTYIYAIFLVQRKCCSICSGEHCPSCIKNRSNEFFPTGMYKLYFFHVINSTYPVVKLWMYFVSLFQGINLWKLMGEFNLHGITAPGRVLNELKNLVNPPSIRVFTALCYGLWYVLMEDLHIHLRLIYFLLLGCVISFCLRLWINWTKYFYFQNLD